MNIKMPTKPTLAKYGLSEHEFRLIWLRQGSVCPICSKVPSTGRTNIDHFHIKGWKKLPPEQRKLYVRGVLCWFCNKQYLSRGITLEKARNIVKYLNT